MKFIDNIIVSLFPKYGIRRLQAKQAIKAYYEGGVASRTLRQKKTNNDPDVEVGAAAENMRANARHLEQNYDLAEGVLKVLVANIVGTGILPIPLLKREDGTLHKEANKAILKLHKNWDRFPEVTGDFDNASAQRITCRSWMRDGEVLTQLLSGKIGGLDHRSIVQFSYELIEADYLPMDLNDAKKGIVQGIQKNKWGRAVSYNIYKTLPNLAGLFDNQSTKRVRAENMIHLKMTTRIRQTRGVTIFATVMKRFEDIKDIEESERVAARVSAAMAGFIRKGSPDMYVAPTGDAEFREMEMMPGMIFDDLKTGEEVGTIGSNRPNNDIIPFIDTNLRFAAAGVGASFSSIAKNYNGTYSAQRQELVEQYNNYGIMWSYFSKRQVLPIYEGFLKMILLTDALDEFNDIDESTLFDVEFSRPPLTWIDPKKEMDGIAKELETEISSKSDIIRRRGGDPDEVFQKRLEEQNEAKEAGMLPSEETKPVEEPKSDEEEEDE